MPAAVLAHVQAGEDEAEQRDLQDQLGHLVARHRVGAVALQTALDGQDVLQEPLGAVVAVFRRLRAIAEASAAPGRSSR